MFSVALILLKLKSMGNLLLTSLGALKQMLNAFINAAVHCEIKSTPFPLENKTKQKQHIAN